MKRVEEIKDHLHNSYFIQLPLNFQGLPLACSIRPLPLLLLFLLQNIRADNELFYMCWMSVIVLRAPSRTTTKLWVKQKANNAATMMLLEAKRGPHINHVLLSLAQRLPEHQRQWEQHLHFSFQPLRQDNGLFTLGHFFHHLPLFLSLTPAHSFAAT